MPKATKPVNFHPKTYNPRFQLCDHSSLPLVKWLTLYPAPEKAFSWELTLGIQRQSWNPPYIHRRLSEEPGNVELKQTHNSSTTRTHLSLPSLLFFPTALCAPSALLWGWKRHCLKCKPKSCHCFSEYCDGPESRTNWLLIRSLEMGCEFLYEKCADPAHKALIQNELSCIYFGLHHS